MGVDDKQLRPDLTYCFSDLAGIYKALPVAFWVGAGDMNLYAGI